ncbi:hypothetical protein BC938DRAFT_475966 [Jimgerdemannia flammicorona]|uniref:F-box domain-containing protein n=1 Tax=Jimgerdemannia flammicorona TaxID=994334 RepID=A0A433PLY0_9FUNG|nr:hypothetical protein BC938DRAFT_475966 [Jimgerdemannia flammicorona]
MFRSYKHPSLMTSFGPDSTTTTTTELANITNEPLNLPAELLIHVFSYLLDQQSSLHACSIVNKQWSNCVCQLLYRHPRFPDTFSWARFILTLTRQKQTYTFGDFVRSVDLSLSKAVSSQKHHQIAQDHQSSTNSTNGATGAASLTITNNTNALATTGVFTFGSAAGNGGGNLFSLNPPTPIPTAVIGTNPSTNTAATNNTASTSNNSTTSSTWMAPSTNKITITTSSMIQLSHVCRTLVSLNLSHTSIYADTRIAETGDYISSLQPQPYPFQQGLTRISLSLYDTIKSLGRDCPDLAEIRVQGCEWITNQVIWWIADNCPALRRLDARKCGKCTVERLTSKVLEVGPGTDGLLDPLASSSNAAASTSSNIAVSASTSITPPPYSALFNATTAPLGTAFIGAVAAAAVNAADETDDDENENENDADVEDADEEDDDDDDDAVHHPANNQQAQSITTVAMQQQMLIMQQTHQQLAAAAVAAAAATAMADGAGMTGVAHTMRELVGWILKDAKERGVGGADIAGVF